MYNKKICVVTMGFPALTKIPGQIRVWGIPLNEVYATIVIYSLF
jgi:hypothetical protein